MPKEAFSQRPVEAFINALVPVDVNPTAPNLDRVLRQQLTDAAHELAPRVNLKELRPLQGAPLVNPSKARERNGRFSVLCGRLARRAGRLDGPRLAPPRQTSALVCAVGREVDLPDSLLFETVLGLLLSHLCCRRQLSDGCEPLPVALGAVVNASSQHPRGKTHCGPLISPPGFQKLLRDIDHGVCQGAGDFMAASRVPDLEHCII